MDRQKIILIFLGAWVSAALLVWFVYSRVSGPKTEALIQVVGAARDLAAGAKLSSSDLKVLSVSKKDAPAGVATDPKTLTDRVLLYPVATNEPIVTTKLTTLGNIEGIASMIEPGMRAVALSFTDTTGVAGLIQPRAHVDVLFTRSGTMSEAIATTILQDVVVLAVNRSIEITPVDPKTASSANRNQAQAATLMVTAEQARILELAKNQGKIGLALRNPLDRSTIDSTVPVGAEVLDPQLYNRQSRLRAAAMGKPSGAAAVVRTDEEWAKLLAGEGGAPAEKPKQKEEPKEPPKPRFVVDVFRGEKHLQEVFQ